MLLRTEYSFRETFAPLSEVVARAPEIGVIADPGAWGWTQWGGEMRVAGKRPLFGSRFWIYSDLELRKERGYEVVAVARSEAEMRLIYRAIELSNTQFYYRPRLTPAQAPGTLLMAEALWPFGELPEGASFRRIAVPGATEGLPSGRNRYPAPEDRRVWAMALGAGAWSEPGPQHVLLPNEWGLYWPGRANIAAEWRAVASGCDDVVLPRSPGIRYGVADPGTELFNWCASGMLAKGLRGKSTYEARLTRELELIARKQYADYFLVIADMIRWAKQRMLVGPARGSSAGSLVCWLTGITELDPLRYGLLFERFIDENREDLPDIDIDFPDRGRAAVMGYMQEKYGAEQFAHLGTIMRYKPKSALQDVARALNIPPYELNTFKDAIIERSSGDSRVNNCLEDSFRDYESGRGLLAKFPDLAIAMRLEGSARQSGMHAAGIVVTNSPVSNFCGIGRERVAQVEKKTAERLNLLKIDALGLRTLSVLEDGMLAAGRDFHELYSLRTDSAAAFRILNEQRFSSVFQFEGPALQSITQQCHVESLADIAALTALARPGPLAGGGATAWLAKRRGDEPPSYADPALEQLTKETLGEIIYQEQVMTITRQLGNFSWADTAKIRKLMSDRKGDEAFGKFEKQFLAGCASNGIDAKKAKRIWDAINSFGSWSFNLSHAVAYGLLSYWCCWLKAEEPAAFAVGALKNAKDDEQAMATLRDALREGLKFISLDKQLSKAEWSIAEDGTLVGGLLGVKGIGAKTAREMMVRRRNGIEWTSRQQTLFAAGSSFNDPFPTRSRFKALYDRPVEFGIISEPLVEIAEVGAPGNYVVAGQLKTKNLRDLNEERFVLQRGGKKFDTNTQLLYFHLEDDTGRILVRVNRYRYDPLGKDVVEKRAIGDWCLVRGHKRGEFRMLDADKIRWLPKEGLSP